MGWLRGGSAAWTELRRRQEFLELSLDGASKAYASLEGAVRLGRKRSKSARAHIAEGTRLFALAGRPTKAQFVKVYGPQGPKMTWEQRAKAGVDAKHFQAALAAKGGS
jgi:hypothetical protein